MQHIEYLSTCFLPASPNSIRLMITLGYDPGIDSDDSVSPPGIGLRAASGVLEYPHHDGSNQLGDLHPGAYSDYTGYEPVSADAIPDPDRWQSVREDGNSESSVQTFYMPQWRQVKPFGFDLVSDLPPQTGPRTKEKAHRVSPTS